MVSSEGPAGKLSNSFCPRVVLTSDSTVGSISAPPPRLSANAWLTSAVKFSPLDACSMLDVSCSSLVTICRDRVCPSSDSTMSVEVNCATCTVESPNCSRKTSCAASVCVSAIFATSNVNVVVNSELVVAPPDKGTMHWLLKTVQRGAGQFASLKELHADEVGEGVGAGVA